MKIVKKHKDITGFGFLSNDCRSLIQLEKLYGKKDGGIKY
tara:strand:+ start:13857 stop:13976 length:120 start_codon:yes stop_codon:yes gene_type:complete